MTGGEIDIFVLYLVPIILASWYVGLRTGILMSLLCAFSGFAADYYASYSYSHSGILYWNIGMRLVYMLIIAYAFSALKNALLIQEQIHQFIVHDLRTPLTNLLARLQTLETSGQGELCINSREIAGTGIVSSNRMLALVDSLLELSDLENDQMLIQQDSVQAAELVGEAIEQVKNWASQDNITLNTVITPPDTKLIADRRLTVHVLTTLISNAIEFSPSGSIITVSVRPDDQKSLQFSVKDQGRGIPEIWAKSIFDKNAQVEARNQGAPVGTGLGLTFCRLAVEAQGGEIWLESEVGKGTTFIFDLPADGK